MSHTTQGQGQVETLEFATSYSAGTIIQISFQGVQYSSAIASTGAFAFNASNFTNGTSTLLSALNANNVSTNQAGTVVTFSDADLNAATGSFTLSATATGGRESTTFAVTAATDNGDADSNLSGTITITSADLNGGGPLSIPVSVSNLPSGAPAAKAAAGDFIVNYVNANFGTQISASQAGTSNADKAVVTLTWQSGGDKANLNVTFAANTTPADTLTFGSFNTQNGGAGPANPIDTIIVSARDPIAIAHSSAIQLDNQSVLEGNNPVSVRTVTITRTDVGESATFYAQFIPGTAQFGLDFASGIVAVTFAAGQASANVMLLAAGDTIIEPDTTVTLNIFSDAGLTTPVASATVTILNDDGFVVTNAFGAGNDLLHAVNAGAEMLAGGRGNDQYLVNSIDDVIIEGPDGGFDTVFTDSSYTLNGGSFIESLSTQTHADTTPINLIGNFHSQLIIGNYGNNVLNGNGGADTLIGLFGDDTYVVGDAAAQIIELDGQGHDVVFANTSYTLGAGVSVEVLSTQTHGDTAALNLSGNEFSQLMIGNMGANVLTGGGGSDTLVGLGGADTFAFSVAPAAGSVVTIADFEAGVDKIALSASSFGGLSIGSLTVGAFALGSAATTTEHRIVYDQATGRLFFDADGSGAGEAVLFAQVTPGTVLNPADMTVI